MKRWDEFWHGPVASVRPYLFVKGFMLLLAMDAWLILSGRSAIYGLGGFNVAHFGWLDAVQPLPSPELYGGTQFLIGLLAMFVVLLPLNRLVAAAIFALWTYGWAMSWLDNDRHHYLVSTVLFCVAMFPVVGRNDARLRVGAWAYKLLGVTVAVVYVWTAIMRCNSAWLSGETLQIVDRPNGLLSSLGGFAGDLGIGLNLYWPLISASVIVIEVIIAVGYLLAVSQDGKPRRTVRVALAVGLLAIGLHAGFEAMELKIGLFSYYMVMTACVFFLPEKPLWTVRRLVDRALWPLEFLFQQSQRALPDLWPCAPAVVMAVIVAAVLGLCGRAIDMPGAFAAGSIAGGALVAAAIVAAIRNSPQLAARYNIAACVAGLAMWIVVSSSSAPLDHYLLRGNQLLELGRTDNAETHFRQAIQLNPKLVKAHCNLGNICFRRGDYPAALQHYQDALSIDPDDADAQHHLSLARAKIARRSRFQ